MSTATQSLNDSRKPRIASAVNTNTTMGSGPNLMRDPSQGLTLNSQADLVDIASGSNISDYDRVIKSAAQKYRHMIPS